MGSGDGGGTAAGQDSVGADEREAPTTGGGRIVCQSPPVLPVGAGVVGSDWGMLASTVGKAVWVGDSKSPLTRLAATFSWSPRRQTRSVGRTPPARALSRRATADRGPNWAPWLS